MSQLQACARRDLSCESFICFLLRITTSIRMTYCTSFDSRQGEKQTFDLSSKQKRLETKIRSTIKAAYSR